MEGLENTPDQALTDSVAATEGLSGNSNGSTIEPVYSKRKMKMYSVTESELKQIGLANIGITGTASLGSAFLAFSLDIFKDTVLAGSIPAAAQAAIDYVQPICLFVGLGFWVFSAFLVWWRKGMLDLIRKESSSN